MTTVRTPAAAGRSSAGTGAAGSEGAADDVSGGWPGAATSMTTRAMVSVVDVVTLVSPAAGASATVRVAGGSARICATAGAPPETGARSSASASMRTTTPSVSVTVVTPAGGAISKVMRAPPPAA